MDHVLAALVLAVWSAIVLVLYWLVTDRDSRKGSDMRAVDLLAGDVLERLDTLADGMTYDEYFKFLAAVQGGCRDRWDFAKEGSHAVPESKAGAGDRDRRTGSGGCQQGPGRSRLSGD